MRALCMGTDERVMPANLIRSEMNGTLLGGLWGVLFPKIAPVLKEHSAQDYLHIPYRNCALSGKSFKSRTHGSDKQNYVLCNKGVRAQNIPKCRFFKKNLPCIEVKIDFSRSSIKTGGHRVIGPCHRSSSFKMLWRSCVLLEAFVILRRS